MQRIPLTLKALRELGPAPLGLYARYKLGLHSGYYKWRTGSPEKTSRRFLPAENLLTLPEREVLAATLGDRARTLVAEADEIVAGQVRLFGGAPAPLKLEVPGPLAHWTAYEKGEGERSIEALGSPNVARPEETDIKFLWEPGRFGWAYTLARAYRLNGDERYPAAFWAYQERFQRANPPYQGSHWSSAQEVALRLMALAFASQVFARSVHTTPERLARLGQALADHAGRIPPTLVYARAQNNNHLLSEAAGLYTAGLALAEHPHATSWRESGWKWFNQGIQSQIDGDGAYIQHSANYHRLMLQLALWVNALAVEHGGVLPEVTRQRLAKATQWLAGLLDPPSGCAPNLGANDGASILPLTACPFQDYRPVVQAASQAFLGKRAFPAGMWDELPLWLGEGTLPGSQPDKIFEHPEVMISGDSWAYLRVGRFHSRPGHADQLHLDLWWRGLNLAPDAGSYLYNAPPPWDNSLALSSVHNTLTVNGREHMSRAGRFLFLDWAQARPLSREYAPDRSWERLVAQHDGYRSLGLVHRRAVTAKRGGIWIVEDVLDIEEPRRAQTSAPVTAPHTACVQWLLPDWAWDLEGTLLRLRSPFGPLTLRLAFGPAGAPEETVPAQLRLVRAGELLHGSGEISPTWGWYSPTYGVKMPALSLRAQISGRLPLSLISEWRLPPAEE